MQALLQDRVALVTGAGSGIGRAVALACAREGARVAVVDVNEEAGRETLELISPDRDQAIFLEADVSDEAQVQGMVQDTVDWFGGLDVACNNAALSRAHGPFHELTREHFQQTLDNCLTNTWLCMKHELPPMLDGGRGAIVNISSNSSLKGQALNSAYASAKSGVNTLTRSAADECAGKGVRINAVSPGVTRTPALEKYFAEQPKIAEQLRESIPMGRLGEPEELAEAVVFLSSDRASFITGQLLSVDGGGSLR